MPESPWLVAALWIGLALLASLISIRVAISVKLKPVIPLGAKHPREIMASLLLLDRMLCEAEEYARGRDGF